MSTNRASFVAVMLRACLAIGVLAGIVLWFSWRAEHNQFAAGCVVAGALFLYLVLAYFFVPDLKGMKPSLVRSSFAVRNRATMSAIRLAFLPGRQLAMWIVDLVAMVCGKNVDHQRTKIDVEL